jgi:hypothetical protein
MSATRLFPGGEPVSVQPDLARLPLQVRLPVDRRPAVAVLAVVCLWAAVGSVLTFRLLTPLIDAGAPSDLALAFAIALVVSAVILYAGWRALRLYVAEQEIEIDEREVRNRGRSLWGATEWREPLGQYRGLRLHELPAADGGPPWQVIEFVHPEAARCLPLLARRSRQPPRQPGRSLAERLQLPVIAGDEAPGPLPRSAPDD